MSNEEMVERIQAGETELITELWLRVVRFIAYMAARYYRQIERPQCDVDDLVQAGYFGFINAVQRYKHNGGSNFLTYMEYWLRNCFAQTIGLRRRKTDAMQYAVSLETPVDEKHTIGDVIEDARAQNELLAVERKIYNEQLRNVLDKALLDISPRYAEAIRAKYYLGQPAYDSYVREGLRQIRSKKYCPQLAQFLDQYVPPCKGGLRPTEDTVIQRDEIEKILLSRQIG